MEIELKLIIAPQDLDTLRQLPLLKQFAVDEPVTEVLYSIYFDTPGLHLKQHRSALRVRQVGKDWIQTYKGGGSVAAGLHQRHEWECLVSGPQIALPLLLPLIDHPAAQAALALPGLAEQLQAVFSTRFERTCWQVRWTDGTEIELALDLGVVEATGQDGPVSEPICELELELKSGTTAGLLAFSQALHAALDLKPSNISKAQRGFALRNPRADSSL